MRLYSESEQKRLSVEVRGLLQFLEDHALFNGALSVKLAGNVGATNQVYRLASSL